MTERELKDKIASLVFEAGVAGRFIIAANLLTIVRASASGNTRELFEVMHELNEKFYSEACQRLDATRN